MHEPATDSQEPPVPAGPEEAHADPAFAPTGVPVTATAAVLFLLAAAWLAAGSTGLLAHPLRHALVWVALGGALITGAAGRHTGPGSLVVLAVAAAVACALASAANGAVCVLAAAFTAAALAACRPPTARTPFRAAAIALLLFGAYRLLYLSAAWVWLAANGLGAALGDVGGALARASLRTGATFAGVDVLVLAVAFQVAWIVCGPAPRLRRGILAPVFLLGAHLLYLVLLARAADLHHMLAAAAKAAGPDRPSALAEALGPGVPWNVPAIACLLQLLVIGLTLRWTRSDAAAPAASSPAAARRAHPVLKLAGVVGLGVAILLALTTTLSRRPLALEGKKLVIYEKLYGNFDRPTYGHYGRLSIGMYGMLEVFVKSLGGTLMRSKDLGEEDLADADALLIIYPSRPWEPGQLERVEQFVRRGGGLLVAGEHTTRITLAEAVASELFAAQRAESGVDLRKDYGTELRVREAATQACYALTHAPEHEIDLAGTAGPEGTPWRIRTTLRRAEVDALRAALDERASYFNQLLAPTAMSVRFDSATFAIGGWLHSYEALSHPTTIGIPDDRNQFGAVIGASVEARLPARPLLVGKWGWNDPGEETAGEAMMGNGAYDADDKLGDIVLAAEQRLGKGVVIAFGDTSSFTNGITMGAHDYTARLFGYLANGAGGPGSAGRQLLASLLTLLLVAALCLARPVWLAAIALVLGLSLAASETASYRAGESLPDGRRVAGSQPNNLAYIDTTHLERAVGESWRMEGLMGIRLNLMRSGFLVLDLNEFTARRLERAGLLLCVAPARAFTPAERAAVRSFVAGGGIFILTASYPDAEPSRELLADFGFEIGLTDPRDPREPLPMGHFKSDYLNLGDYVTFVRFHEAWPVACLAADAPPAGWRQRERMEEPTFRRTGHWYAGKVLAAAVPWLQPTTAARVVANGIGGHPVVLLREFGHGKVAVVGDTGFAMNKNLEIESGQPFDGLRENPHFWRWFLTVLRGEEEWIPPRPVPESHEGGN
ncbi:MAG: hypothetical protein JXQ29_18190 [Planctomycetes bacterium]|nr:hypothetical protein [Planctomycetota bacterium]